MRTLRILGVLTLGTACGLVSSTLLTPTAADPATAEKWARGALARHGLTQATTHPLAGPCKDSPTPAVSFVTHGLGTHPVKGRVCCVAADNCTVTLVTRDGPPPKPSRPETLTSVTR